VRSTTPTASGGLQRWAAHTRHKQACTLRPRCGWQLWQRGRHTLSTLRPGCACGWPPLSSQCTCDSSPQRHLPPNLGCLPGRLVLPPPWGVHHLPGRLGGGGGPAAAGATRESSSSGGCVQGSPAAAADAQLRTQAVWASKVLVMCGDDQADIGAGEALKLDVHTGERR
jgi:hypothetical protein